MKMTKGCGLLWAGVGALLLLGACSDEPAEPTPISLENTQPGTPEQPKSGALAVDEANIRVAVVADGLEITIPVETLAGVGQKVTLETWLTTLTDDEGTKYSSTFSLTGGTRDVVIPAVGATLPETQGEQAGHLVRYRATLLGEGSPSVYGQRSLYYATPKLGLQVWAPSRLDAGTSTVVRVWVRDLLEGGALVAGVPVTIAGQTLETDIAGQAEFEVSVPATDEPYSLSVVALHEGALVTSTRTIDVVPPGAPLLFVSTDKPLYRPGQTIHIRALALAQKDLLPVADSPVTLEVLDGKDNKIFKQEGLTDAFGVVSLTAPLASQVNVGTYSIRAVMSDVTTEQHVEVSEEKLPKFQVTTTLDQPWFAPGDPITGVVQARYFFGKAVIDGQVTIAVTGGQEATFTGTTDAEGLMPFELPASDGSNLSLAVTVVDSAGFSVEKAASVTIAAPKINVALTPEGTTLPAGGDWRVFVRTTGPTGAPVAASCTSPAIAEPLALDPSGIGVLLTDHKSVSVTCTSEGGLVGTATVNLSVSEEMGLLIRADKAIYAQAETIVATVIAGADLGPIYVDRVHRGRIVDSHLVEVTDGVGEVELAVGSDTGTMVLTAYAVSGVDGASAASAERIVFVQKPFAEVSVTTDAASYLPGGEATLTFEVKDEAGQGKAAAIGVTIADEAVFALAGTVGPNDVKGFFLLDDAPQAVKPFALQASADAVQVAAAAGMAQTPSQMPATATGLTLDQLQGQAYGHFSSPLQQLRNGLRTDIEVAAQAKRITAQNAVKRMAEIAAGLYDFWGQKLVVDPEIKDYGWGIKLRVEIASFGPDELDGTWDDWSSSFSVYIEDRSQRDSDGEPMAGPSADAASGPAGEGGFDRPAPPPNPDEHEANKDSTNAPKKRTEFPETLYVNPSLITDGSGKATVTLPMADVITEWRVSMIANTADGRVGGGKGGITVFQDFFVDADLPRKLTQNDELHLPVGVFNFTDDVLGVTVQVAAAPWFELLGPAQQTVEVPAGKSMAVPFPVKVLEAGHHSLDITAASPTFTDGVVRTVQVLPDGQRIEGAVSGPLEASLSKTVTFPGDAIDGGNDALIKVMGGPSAQMVDGIEALLNSPTGCFEPMMNATWINALVLDYMAWTDSGNATLEQMARANLDDGYQQCATFECTGGGFTWFGDPDPAHPILTAFALVMLRDIAAIRDVDANLVARAQGMLVEAQDMFGGWTSEQGTKNQALPWDELRSTCVVAWGLAASDYQGEALAKGIQFISGALNLDADTYTMAMCANALLEAAPEDPDTDSVVAELLERAQVEGGETRWSSDYPGVTMANGAVIEVETTALVAQALYKLDTPPQLVEGALKFLAGKKSPDGNFLSTQGTIQSMRAFVAAAKFAAGGTDADISVKVGGETIFSVHIDDSNREVVHLVSLSEHATSAGLPVSIEYSGEGKLYYQLTHQHYVPWTEAGRPVGPLMDVHVTYSELDLTVGQSTVMTITVTSSGSAEPGDMPMVDFGVPAGFDADLGNLDTMVASDPNVARYEIKGDRVQIYLHSLPKEPGTAFEVGVPISPRFPMQITAPSARAWSFYKPEEGSESLPAVLTVTDG